MRLRLGADTAASAPTERVEGLVHGVALDLDAPLSAGDE